MSATPKVMTAVASLQAISRAVKDDLENILDVYKAAIDKRVCAEVDAGCCRTSSDYRRRDEALDNEENVRDQVLAKLVEVIHQTITHHNLGIIR